MYHGKEAQRAESKACLSSSSSITSSEEEWETYASHEASVVPACQAPADSGGKFPAKPSEDFVPTFVTPADVGPAFTSPADVSPTFVKPADVSPTFVKPADVSPMIVKSVDVSPTFAAVFAPAELAPTIVAPPDVPQTFATVPVEATQTLMAPAGDRTYAVDVNPSSSSMQMSCLTSDDEEQGSDERTAYRQLLKP